MSKTFRIQLQAITKYIYFIVLSSATSFESNEMKPVSLTGGKSAPPTTIARAAGYTFEKADQFLELSGNPNGIKSYRPHNAVGEDSFCRII